MPRKKELLPACEGYLPQGLSATELHELCHGRPFDADRILVFFKYLLNATRRYNDGRIDPTLFVEIHVSHLEELFAPNRVKAYREFMAEHELIETKGYHADSGRAYRYRLHTRCIMPQDVFDFDQPLYSRVSVTSARAIKADLSYKRFKFNEMLSRLPEPYNVLAPMMRTIEVDTTSPAAIALMASLRLNSKYDDPYIFDEQLQAIKNGENEYYFVCKFGRRFHSHWTSLKKELRPLLHFPGHTEPLTDLDVVNSQPWLTSILDAEMVKQYVPEAYDEVKDLLTTSATESMDFKEYRRLCAEGQIYERWEQVLRTHIGEDWRAQMLELDKETGYSKKPNGKMDPNWTDRRVAKTLFFRVIFAKQELTRDKNGALHPMKRNFRVLNEAFKNEWPSVWRFFAAIKRTKFACNTSKKEGGHSNLALLMQRIESSLMQAFVLRCLENGINNVVPIYDGALLPAADLSMAKELFQEVVTESGARTNPQLG